MSEKDRLYSEEPSHADIVVTNTVFDDGAQGVYWRVDLPQTHVRPYLENTHYGKWNYPLGVTLLGLLQTGQELGRDDYIQYVLDHISLSTSFDRYGLWDRDCTFGRCRGVSNEPATLRGISQLFGTNGSTLIRSE
ncbi:hypothetical protein [Paenibacillus sp. PCH8]|uniref:hypothetical protein n=1 Tax=Paenibacillus sp. PCH8 TaxID=2066524 RepID=UPI0021574F0D|nr:hypothetical protein [Paenibacillus sp. PCH8]